MLQAIYSSRRYDAFPAAYRRSDVQNRGEGRCVIRCDFETRIYAQNPATGRKLLFFGQLAMKQRHMSLTNAGGVTRMATFDKSPN